MSITFQSEKKYLQLSSDSFDSITYSLGVNFLASAADSNVIIFHNLKPLTETETLYIASAMLLSKPIVLIRTPVFNNSVNLFHKRLILSKLSKIYVFALDKIDDSDKGIFLNNLSDVNYLLTKYDSLFLRILRKRHFRKLELAN
jgi:hypothetical protein